MSLSDSIDPIAGFTLSLIDICGKCIPKTSTSPKKSNPWYNQDCKEAIRERKQALSKFCKYPTKENLNNVWLFRAKARRTIKSAKRKSWRTYVSKLTTKRQLKKFGIWYEKYLVNQNQQVINIWIQILSYIQKRYSRYIRINFYEKLIKPKLLWKIPNLHVWSTNI